MKDTKKTLGFSTRAIHGGQSPDPTTGAVMPPIYATSTYAQSSPGVHKGYEYSRTQNPTRMAYERCIADLEGGTRGFAFASGMAATATLLELRRLRRPRGRDGRPLRRQLPPVRARAPPLGEPRLHLRGPLGPEGRRGRDPAEHAHDLDRDADQSAAEARRHRRASPRRRAARGILVVVDNTFATPWIQRPLELGADIVMHSATKFLNGHSDMVGGVAVVGDAELGERIGFLQNAIGAIGGPFDSFLALRGLKTLPLRMRQSSESALAIASMARAPPARRARALSGPAVASAARARAAADGERRQRDRDVLPEGRRCRRRGASSSGSRCSRWPRAWAASRASSTTRRS